MDETRIRTNERPYSLIVKNTNVVFIFILSLFLVSCGQGGKTSASFKVSSSFALSNSGFDGGLVLFGKSGSQSFSRAVNFTGGSGGNVVVLNLPNGTWNFYATGWKNNVSGPMTGDIFCGETVADLKGGSLNLNLNISQNKCNSNIFANTQMLHGTGPNYIKKLSLSSCNGFYTWSAGIPSSITAASTSPNFCSNTNDIPLDLRNQAKSFRVKAISKSIADSILPGELSSPCLNFDEVATNTVKSQKKSDLRIPSYNVPVEIALFKDEACSDKITDQKMLDGLASSPPNGNKFFLNTGGADWGALVLPSNQTNKGYSPLIGLLPTLKCSGNLCIDSILPSGFDYYASRNSNLSDPTIRLVIDRDSKSAVADYQITNLPSDWSLNGGSCQKDKEEFSCTFNLSSDPTFCNDGANHYCWSITSPVKNFKFNFKKRLPDGSFPPTFTVKSVYILKEPSLMKSLALARGMSGKEKKIIFNDDDSGDDDSPTGDYGVLSLPRFIFTPEVAGLLGEQEDTCASLNKTIQRVFTRGEDGPETIEISIRNATPTVASSYFNQFFCDSTDPSSAGCGSLGGFSGNTAYEKKIVVKKLLSPGNWQHFITMEFSCNSSFKSGHFEERNLEYHDSGALKRDEKSKIVWTTPFSGTSRVEFSRQEREYDSNPLPTRYDASLIRAYNVPTGLQVSSAHYRRDNYSGSLFDEKGGRTFSYLEGMNFYSDNYQLQKSGATTGSTILEDSPTAYTDKSRTVPDLNTKGNNDFDQKLQITPSLQQSYGGQFNPPNPWVDLGPSSVTSGSELEIYSLHPDNYDPTWAGSFFSP
jgi:hypothetical protein